MDVISHRYIHLISLFYHANIRLIPIAENRYFSVHFYILHFSVHFYILPFYGSARYLIWRNEMNSQVLEPSRNYGDLLDSVNTVMGRVMYMKDNGDHVRASIRSNGNNLDIDIPVALIEDTKVTSQSIVKLVLSTDSQDVPVAKDLQVIRMAQPMPVALEDIESTDLKKRHLYIRSDKMLATARFRHFVNKYAREYLDEQGCINVQTPILTEASCVCSGDVFAFPYYGKTIANLIQSPWMYADAMSSAFDRVSDAKKKHPAHTWWKYGKCRSMLPGAVTTML